jgi:hypothetical protein
VHCPQRRPASARLPLARCRRRTGTVCRMRGRKSGRGSLHPGMRGHGGRGRGRGRKGPVPKRVRSGMREPTAFDGDAPARRVSCVLLLAPQPKHLLDAGVWGCTCPSQLVCRFARILTVSGARCRRERLSVGGDAEQAAACASGAACAGLASAVGRARWLCAGVAARCTWSRAVALAALSPGMLAAHSVRLFCWV